MFRFLSDAFEKVGGLRIQGFKDRAESYRQLYLDFLHQNTFLSEQVETQKFALQAAEEELDRLSAELRDHIILASCLVAQADNNVKIPKSLVDMVMDGDFYVRSEEDGDGFVVSLRQREEDEDEGEDEEGDTDTFPANCEEECECVD